jgi:hypothetical protein
MVTKKSLDEQLQSIADRVAEEKKRSIYDLYIRRENGAYCLAERMPGGAYRERSRWFDTAKEMEIFLYAFEEGLFFNLYVAEL